MGGVGEKIMVSALTGVMSPVLGKLTNLIEKKYTELKNVRKKLEQLRKELMAINVALEKYAAMVSPDVQVKAWVAEMRELAYDMEDSIDLFTHHVDHESADTTTGVRRFFHKKIRMLKKLHYRHKFAKEIQDLHVLVNEASQRRERYKIEEGNSRISHTEIDPRLQALYVEVEKLVGFEGPSEEIIGRILGENSAEGWMVVSIVGPGGSGKTTLAKQVYDKIKGQFSCVAFVSVSQNPSMDNLLRELLSKIIESHGGVGSRSIAMGCYRSDQQLIEKLRAYLQDERYLVVIDDVWTKLAWDTIQCALPKNAHTSRIIMTTRINSIGSLLATKPRTKEEWGRALNSVRSMHQKDSGLEVIDNILSLSYNDLPHHMRNCLLHLSTFPEDYTIHKDVLVWRWIAEGFISEKKGFTLKQVAESYFYEFINRSLVQPIIPRYERDNEEGCKVHDIVLNFLISRSAEENFSTLLDGQDRPSPDQRIRRLSVWDNPEHAPAVSWGTMNLSHIRSISTFNVGVWKMPPILDLPVLRVLDLGRSSLRDVDLNCILSLFHLRYLGFRGVSGVMLPAQIGILQYLQTLDLIDTGVTQLPESIVQLKRLMCLIGEQIIMPAGFGNMEALEELGTLDGCKCSINFGEDLALLSKLRVLRVTFMQGGTSNLESRKKSLMLSLCKLGGNSLQHVNITNIVSGGDCLMESWCPPPNLLQKFIHASTYYSRFPKWINSCLCDLTYLHICVQKMEMEYLHILEDLPALRILYLFVEQVPEDGLIISHSAFRCLKCFSFYNVAGPGLVFEGGMRMLEWLQLGFDADKARSTYGSLEVGIGHLSSLKHIDITVRMISKNKNDPAEVAVKSAINGQIKMLPNCPTVDIGFHRRRRLAGTE